MKKISQVIIIYNPKSTGDGEKNAVSLRSSLKKVLPDTVRIAIKKTQYAGNAEEMVRHYGTLPLTTLVVSSSGDGGYNEVINGVLLSPSGNLVTSVLPSGNANDHFRAVGSQNLVENIHLSKYKKIDVIKVASMIDGKAWVRYAHSYVGIGISPVVGKQLTKSKLNVFNEKWLLIKYFFKFRYSKIRVNGSVVKYSSLLFSNIDTMSKVIRLSDDASIDDGRFEINSIKYQPAYKLLLYLFKATTVGLTEHSSQKSYVCTTISPLLIQLDGEIFTLDANTQLSIEAAPRALTCIT